MDTQLFWNISEQVKIYLTGQDIFLKNISIGEIYLSKLRYVLLVKKSFKHLCWLKYFWAGWDIFDWSRNLSEKYLCWFKVFSASWDIFDWSWNLSKKYLCWLKYFSASWDISGWSKNLFENYLCSLRYFSAI